MTQLAFLRPAEDLAGQQIATWGLALIGRVSAPTTAVDMTGSANVTRTRVEALLAQQPDHLLWFGHGREDALTCQGAAILDSANIGLIAGGVVVAMACQTALRFGWDAVRGGVRAFLGFDDRVGWPDTAPDPTRAAVVDGLDCLVTQAHDLDCGARQLRAGFARARVEYEQHGTTFYGLSAGESERAWLWAKSNAASVQVLGDGSATLT